jgi:starch synthase
MKIFFAASEMTPYAKTGGLGDVVGALSSALRERGHEVTCCLPYYRCAREAAPGAKPIGLALSLALGSRAVTGEVLEWTQPDGVRVLFLRRDEFYDRSELYTTGVRDYEDNAERFLFFSKAVVELIGDARFRPDVVHCHDWQAAFVPVQMSYKRAAREERQRQNPPLASPPGEGTDVKTVLTIHNIAYQGMFGSPDFPLTNLPGEFFTPDALEFYGRMNLLKGGIVFADTITTVSPTYAEEIQTAEGGYGLDTTIATRAADLHGIVNGVDYSRWNPATDPHLRQRYGPGDLSGKQACHADLLRKLGLGTTATPIRNRERAGTHSTRSASSGQAGSGQAVALQAGRPVAGFVSRLTAQKGVEILAGALEELVESGLSLAILGKGERAYEEMLTAAARRYPGRVAVRIAHDEELAHQIQGGADMLLVPSHYEPCGLTQLYALKYGTIPVVRATGGLDDTVEAYEPRTGRGTGFKFAPYTSAALVAAVRQAIVLHRQPKKWQKLMSHAMAGDFSWQASVLAYEKLYAAIEEH